MKFVKKHGGLVFRDQFTSQSNWVSTSPSNTGFGTGLVITHNPSKDVRVLRDLPQNVNLIELAVDYTPIEENDVAGIILYASDDNYLEIKESADETQSPVTDYKIVRRNGEFNVFALRDDVYEFVTSSKEDYTKFGFITKKGAETFESLRALEVFATRGAYLAFTALPEGAYGEFTVNETTYTEQSVDGVIAFEMAHAEQTINVRLLTADGQEMYANETLYSAGTEFYAASELEVLKDGVALETEKDNTVGSLVGEIVEKQLEIRNPLAYPINNVVVQIGEYVDKKGYLFADVALDNNGAPGTYGDIITIPTLEPNSSVFFWFKFDRTGDTEGLNSLYSVIGVLHD